MTADTLQVFTDLLNENGYISDAHVEELIDEVRRLTAIEEKLRDLLIQAEEVGCFKRDWQEMTERWITSGNHPYYETEMKTEELIYREARTALYAAAGIPEEEGGRRR